MAAVNQQNSLTLLEVLGTTVMALFFLIGVVCLIAALFSFNGFYHEKRGEQMKGGNLLGDLAGFTIFQESAIAVASVFLHWKENRSGRTTFLTGVGLLVSGTLIAWATGAFQP